MKITLLLHESRQFHGYMDQTLTVNSLDFRCSLEPRVSAALIVPPREEGRGLLSCAAAGNLAYMVCGACINKTAARSKETSF